MPLARARTLVPSAVVAVALLGCNQPPDAATVEIGPLDARTGDDLVVLFADDAVDPNARDAVTYAFRWFQDGALRAELTGDRVSAAETAKGEHWRVEVVASDGRADGPLASAEIVVANTPPVASAWLTPEAPLSTEDLVVDVSSYDADGDTVSATFRWTVDGFDAGIGEPVVPAARTAKGQVWEVTVTPHDGDDAGEPIVLSVNVDNRQPVVERVTLFPSSPTADVAVEAVAQASDHDGDPLSLRYIWTVGGAVVQEGASAVLAPGPYAKGDEVGVTVVAHDGYVSGAPVAAVPVGIVNAAPSIEAVRTDPAELRVGTDVTCVPEGWRDADGDVADYAFAWTVDGALVSTDPILDGAAFTKHAVVACAATPRDGEAEGTPLASRAAVVRNTPPVLDAVRLSSESPTVGETLTAQLAGLADADDDAVTVSHAWYVDGALVSDKAVLGGAFARGDEIWVVVTPHDGEEAGTPYQSPHARVRNGAPVVREVSLSPAAPRAGDDVVATVDAFDPDGDAVTLHYAWTVDGAPVQTGLSGVLPGGALVKGQAVAVTVTPADGALDGVPVSSAPVAVRNTAPTLGSARVMPEEIYEASVLACEPEGWSDPDGDSVGYLVAWYVDGMAAGTGATLDGSSFGRGAQVSCALTPEDGADTGEAVHSAARSVLNTPPRLAGVTLTTATPTERDVVSAVLLGAGDDDDDPLTFDYQWFVDGAPVSVAAQITGDLFDRGDEIQVTVTARDDADASLPRSSEVATAVNSVPEVTRVALGPDAVFTDTTVQALVEAEDADGDAVTLRYVWTVDGSPVQEGDGATLSGALFARDQSLGLIVTPSDGSGSGAPLGAGPIAVRNSPPSAPEVAIVPSSPFEQEDDVHCRIDAEATDADDDALSYRFAWTLDGLPAATEGAKVHPGDLVAASETWAGQLWACSVVADDGTNEGLAAVADAEITDWEGVRAFSACGQVGRAGPSQELCDGVYASGALEGEVVVADGIQEWTVPASGTYRIEAWGAAGGSIGVGRGGKGARVRGDFDLAKGDVLRILVGQQGYQGVSTEVGGGGGTFVARDDEPLLVAGGGGSQGGCGDNTGTYALGRDASTDEAGLEGYGDGSASGGGVGGAPGMGGGAVTNSYPGGAGGGFFGGGAYGVRSSGSGCSVGASGFSGLDGDAGRTAGGQAFLDGGLGGRGCYKATGAGGFGGGGGAGGCGGAGGGGYSGGGGGASDRSGGGGGGSFVAGDGAQVEGGAGAGAGAVTIDRID